MIFYFLFYLPKMIRMMKVLYILIENKIFIEVHNYFIIFIDTYPILKIFKNEQKIEINLSN